MTTVINCNTIHLNRRENFRDTSYCIWLVLSGSIRMSAGIHSGMVTLSEYDLALTAPYEEYVISPSEDNIVLRTEISASFVSEAFENQDFVFRCNSVLYPDDYQPLILNLAQLASLCAETGSDSMKLMAEVYNLLHTLKSRYCITFSDKVFLKDEKQDMSDDSRSSMILRYIHMHYREPLTLEEVAEHVHLTPQYLSKYFKTRFGTGFLKYLTRVRLESAYSELVRTSTPVTKVAMDNGFSNLSSFNKAFLEQYGASPKTYRLKKIPDQKDLPYTQVTLGDYNELLDSTMYSDSNYKRTGDVANLEVKIDCSHSQPFRKNWKELVNLGGASNCLLQAFQEQLSEVNRQLHFKYARITNVFCDKVLYLDTKGQIMGFPAFTRIINFLQSQELIPFLDLGAKASPIELESDSNVLPRKGNYGYSDAQWKRLMEGFLQYCIHTWGLDYVSRWKFELWVPRGLDNNLSGIEPAWARLYTRRLMITLDVIHTVIPEAMVGGPSLNADDANQENFMSLFREMNKQGCIPDFISAYLYPSYLTHVSEDYLDTVRQKIACIVYPCDILAWSRLNTIKKLIQDYFDPAPPVYVTEFSADSTSRCFINDTSYNSSFITKTVIDSISLADTMGFWNLSDIIGEEFSYPQLFFGSNGMLTRDGLKKSSYYAFWLMNKLGDRLVEKGNNYMICSRYKGHYEILVHNFNHLSKEYCLEHFKLTKVPKRYMVKAFEEDVLLECSICLTNIQKGTYLVKKYMLDRLHGDVQKGAEDLLAKYNLELVRSEELQYLESVYVPEQTLDLIECDGTTELSTSLMPNGIVLYIMTLYQES